MTIGCPILTKNKAGIGKNLLKNTKIVCFSIEIIAGEDKL